MWSPLSIQAYSITSTVRSDGVKRGFYFTKKPIVPHSLIKLNPNATTQHTTEDAEVKKYDDAKKTPQIITPKNKVPLSRSKTECSIYDSFMKRYS